MKTTISKQRFCELTGLKSSDVYLDIEDNEEMTILDAIQIYSEHPKLNSGKMKEIKQILSDALISRFNSNTVQDTELAKLRMQKNALEKELSESDEKITTLKKRLREIKFTSVYPEKRADMMRIQKDIEQKEKETSPDRNILSSINEELSRIDRPQWWDNLIKFFDLA